MHWSSWYARAKRHVNRDQPGRHCLLGVRLHVERPGAEKKRRAFGKSGGRLVTIRSRVSLMPGPRDDCQQAVLVVW